VEHIFVQVDQEVKSIKASLNKNMKNVNLAQTKHLDSHLLQYGDDDDSGSPATPASKAEKPEAPTSLESVAPTDGQE
jgi:hypothetical protein